MADTRGKPTLDGENTLESATLQMAMAFGQGTGGMVATPAAVLLAVESIRPTLEENLKRWDAYALTFLEFSRGFGRLSAHRAVRDGRVVVIRDDVAWSLEHLRATSFYPMSCGC
jgi:hypothetical protein